MSQGRLTCPRCGSNNFDTVTACWKCSAPLTAAAAAGPAPAVAQPVRQTAVYTPPTPHTIPTPMPAMAAPAGDTVAYRAASVATSLGNAAAANRAAFWLGMLFPYFGLPIGLAFIMCDDRRRQEVGRLCILWSLLSTALHILVGFVTLLGMRQYLAAVFGAVMNGMQRGAGGGGIGGGMEGGF